MNTLSPETPLQADDLAEAAVVSQPPSENLPRIPTKRLGTSPEEILKSLKEAKEAILKAHDVSAVQPMAAHSEIAKSNPKVEAPKALAMTRFDEDESDNARKHRRITVSARAKIALTGRQPEDARLIDLSLGGAGLITERNLPIGALCHVMFRLIMPSGKLFTLVAHTQAQHSTFSSRHSGFKTGFKFGKLPEPTLAALVEFIADKTKTVAL